MFVKGKDWGLAWNNFYLHYTKRNIRCRDLYRKVVIHRISHDLVDFQTYLNFLNLIRYLHYTKRNIFCRDLYRKVVISRISHDLVDFQTFPEFSTLDKIFTSLDIYILQKGIFAVEICTENLSFLEYHAICAEFQTFVEFSTLY